MRGGHVAVVGGSIAGCAAALAAARGGAERVSVFERAEGELRDRGVGLALHSDRYAELEAAGYVAQSMPWARLSRRKWVVRDGLRGLGRPIATQPFPFRAYSWGSLWNELRRRVPDGTAYRSGAIVSAAEADADGVRLQLTDGHQERFDAVIGADGYRSVIRAAMFPGLSPTYAGYFGWRGTSQDVPQLAQEERESAHTVVFPGGHCMIYRIPDGRGSHRLNWVLYTAPSEDPELRLEDLRTPTSLPPGRLSSALTGHLRDLVDEHFPPYWAACVLQTPPETTFVQPIYDLELPHYATGRLLLAGDAATVARPHTGGGSLKALQDATALETAMRSGTSWEEIVTAYDADRRAVGAAMVTLGRRLGRAQVEHTPDWAAMREPDFTAWWQEQHQGSDRTSGFGGHALRRD
ncbi:MAG TPA: FAD-dependent monooxygenase [Streptomyces sp.]|nr:FAD-dependent monooxygenase [Streptomyces sp.]